MKNDLALVKEPSAHIVILPRCDQAPGFFDWGGRVEVEAMEANYKALNAEALTR